MTLSAAASSTASVMPQLHHSARGGTGRQSTVLPPGVGPRARPPARAPAGLGAKQVVVSTHMSLEAGGTRIAISRLPQLCLRMGWFFRFESQASAYQHSIARPKNAPARLAATTVFAIGSTAAKRSSANAMATGMRAIPANRVASARTLSLSWPRAHRPSAGAAGARCWC